MKKIETLALIASLLLHIPFAQSAEEKIADQEEIIRILKKAQNAADQGHKDSQRAIGKAYEVGMGNYPKDSQKAFFWFFKAAEQGDAESQVEVGIAYKYGDGVTKNLEEAMGWLIKAEAAGSLQGRFELSLVLVDSRRKKVDNNWGISLLNKNIEAKHAQSYWLMGALLMAGEILEKNENRALALWQAGYRLGSLAATFELGKFYIRNDETFDMGMSMIGLAATRGFSPAIRFLTVSG